MILYINGLISLPQYLTAFMLSASYLIIVLIVHETGHYLYMKYVLRLKNITAGAQWDKKIKGVYVAAPVSEYSPLTNFEKIGLRVWGVLFGILPFLFHTDVLVFILYVLACSQDFKDIFKYHKLIKTGD